MYHEISQCRVCGNLRLDPILDLGMQALTGIFPKSRDEPVPFAPLRLVKCSEESGDTCGLVQLKHSVDPETMYGIHYGYRSGLNQSMMNHLRSKAEEIQAVRPLHKGDLVLDIGSNDGTFLKYFEVPGIELLGMDPTGTKFRDFYPEHIELVPTFFSAAAFRDVHGSRKAAVVTSIAMFYDLESPLDFMREVAEILSPDGIWLFEQSYLPAMLTRTAYDTICHEHLEYYGLKQIQWMCQRVGLKILDVELNDTNGGSFSVIVAKESTPFSANEACLNRVLREEEGSGLNALPIYKNFHERVLRHREELIQFLDEADHRGERVMGYGASTKGNVVLQFCGLTPSRIPLIAEVNPDKFGSFTPGTLIPIVSEAEVRSMRPDALLVLPWHFRDSIVSRESAFLSQGGRLIFPLPKIEVVATSLTQSSGWRN
jgi:NDP-4-keto-2,6-dideoxyhexose 3-C-methyltransferase